MANSTKIRVEAAQDAPNEAIAPGDASCATAPLTVAMPTPPSVNHLFATFTDKRGNQRRIKSRDYQAWEEEAGRAQGWRRVTEERLNKLPWRVYIVAFNLPRNRDVDNVIKPTLDLICTMTGLRDSWCEEVTAKRAMLPEGTDAFVMVSVYLLTEV